MKAIYVPEPEDEAMRDLIRGRDDARTAAGKAKQELTKKESEAPGNEIEIIDVADYKPRRIPPPTWRECIKKSVGG